MDARPTTPPPLVECGFCDAQFVNEMLRIQHVRQYHDEFLKFSCQICGIKCETQAKVTSHTTAKHKKPREYKGDLKKPGKKSSTIQNRDGVEKACLRYALHHGRHKAQLKYAKLHPELKLGWRKISELMTQYKHDDRFEKHYSSAIQSKVKARNKRSVSKAVRLIPKSVKNECARYGVIHGADEAQWEFTVRFPRHVFPYASVKKWIDTLKYQHSTRKYPDEFIAGMDEVLLAAEGLTIGDFEDKVKNKVILFNENKAEGEVIDEKNAVAEWLHQVNLQIRDRERASRPNHCSCGNVYKTEEELRKHKPKCWVPETEGRTQRACRINKSVASECDSVSESESDISSSVIDEGGTLECSDCDYRSFQRASIKKHARFCPKTKLSSKNGEDEIEDVVKDAKNSIKTDILTLKNCKRCPFKHVTIEGLREHYRVSHDTHLSGGGREVSLHCDTCNDTFLTYVGFQEHVCGERQTKVIYQRVKPRVSPAITLGSGSIMLFICPRCVSRFDTMPLLTEHYNAKLCTKVELYA